MHRMMLGALLAGSIGVGAAAPAWAGDTAVNKPSVNQPSVNQPIEALNRLTGLEPTQGMLHELLNSPDKAKALVQAGLPLAQKKEGLSYNAALVLALAAADQKDFKASDAFFHVCGDLAVKDQSVRRLAQSYGTLIELYYDAKKYTDCARVCREVLELKTDDGKPRIVYRAFTDERGDTDFNEYAAFDSAKPMKPMIERYLVRALAKQGKYDQAMKLADKLIKNEVDWRGRHLKGWVLREAGEYGPAAAVYEEVLGRVERDSDLDPEERGQVVEQLRAELSNTYVDLKQIDKATAQLELLVKKKPNEPGYYNDLGYILADHGLRLDEAEKMVRKALELDRAKRQKAAAFDPKTDHDNGAYLDSLGWVLFKKKELPEARKYLEQAIADKRAQHIEIYDHLGDVCLAMGDRDAAIRAWAKGLEYVTDSRRDQRLRAEVEKKLDRAKSNSASK